MLNRKIDLPVRYPMKWGDPGNPINLPVRYPMKWGDPGNPIRQEAGKGVIPMATLTKCSECGYPIQAKFEGETAICAYCGEKLEAVISQGPLGSFVLFMIGIGLGIIVGPAIISSSKEGSEWLGEYSAKRIRELRERPGE